MAAEGSRVIWLDPNMSNNQMVPLEDLSIKVEFTAERKGRSIIYSGTETKNTVGANAAVNFIEGSTVGGEPQKSLTTRYTEAIALEVMNPQQQTDDFESLGIESIDVEFNSSYTPVIKIKFIDVRGNAILAQGNLSKYRMFFELPYPIFKLNIKGFYGKTVSYCLHMLRWNASFNSNTGNFEIQAEFIGYTYALLVDLLLGLVRAAVRTDRGQTKLESKKDDYGDNSHLIISIDDLILRFATLVNNLKKMEETDNTANQLATYDEIDEDITSLKGEVNKLSLAIYDGTTPNNYFRSDDGQALAVPPTDRTRIDAEILAYKANMEGIVATINSKISSDSLKFDSKTLSDIVVIKDILKKELKEGDPVSTVINKSSGKYTNDDTSKEYVKDLLAKIGTLPSSISDDTNMDIYNLKRLYYHIDNTTSKLNKNKEESTTEFGKKLVAEAESVIGFSPSIRNIFRVLTVNSEVFLEVLRDVSVEAQTDKTGKRATEFKKISGNVNVNEVEVNKSNIYPWPEYRKQKNGESGFEETYLGTETAIIPQNIDEVVFTEEMMTRLMEVAKFDKDLDTLAAGTDVDSNPLVVQYPWYPVSAIDTPVTPNMTENPYTEPVNNNKRDEVIRLALLRAFLLVGVGTYNNKILSIDPTKSYTYLHGALEAENFIATCRRFGQNGQRLAQLVATAKNTSATDSKTLVDEAIDFGLKGSTEITNAPLAAGKAKPIMGITDLNGNKFLSSIPSDEKALFRYTYHYNSDALSYLPVNKDFGGTTFYNADGKFKDYEELKTTAGDVVYVNKKRNQPFSKFSMFTRGINSVNPDDEFWTKDLIVNNDFEKNVDGAYTFSIKEYNEYSSGLMKPSFGQDVVTEFGNLLSNGAILKASSVYHAVISPGYALNSDLFLENLNTVGFNKQNGYSWLEIDVMNLDGSPIFPDADEDNLQYAKFISEFKPSGLADGGTYSALLSFYSQFNGDVEKVKTVGSTTRVELPIVGTYFSAHVDLSRYKDWIDKKTENGVEYTYYNYSLSQNYVTDINDINDESPAFGNYAYIRKPWVENGYTKQKELIQLKLEGKSNIYLPFIEFGTAYDNGIAGTNICNYSLSLFGSWFYNQQKDLSTKGGVMVAKAAKALLFLHCIPWQGVKTFSDFASISDELDLREYLMLDKYQNWTNVDYDAIQTKVRTIKGLFQGNSAFIHAPKAWVLFIGGILYRARYGEIIQFKPSGGDYSNVLIDSRMRDIRRGEYLYTSHGGTDPYASEQNPYGMCFGNEIGSYGDFRDTFTPVDRALLFLPWEIQKIFIDYFVNWVNDSSTGFGYIQKELEIWRGYDKGNFYEGMYKEFQEMGDRINKSSFDIDNTPYFKISLGNLSKNSSNYDAYTNIPENVVNNYDLISADYNEAGAPIRQINLIHKQNTAVMNNIVGLLTEPVILQNGNPSMWNHDLDVKGSTSRDSITIRYKQMKQYLTGFYDRLLALNQTYQTEAIPDEDDQIQQEVFGTTDDNEIKLMIYRTLSSINDKWLNGSKTQNVFVQCGNNAINQKDLSLAKKYRTTATEPSLIDTFRFVDRSLADIGDKFFLNIEGVVELIRYNYNQSLFDVINKILVDNNFNFIPLPSFVNFNNLDELKEVFTPYSYNDIKGYESSGPSFVCVYVGQTSVNLDLGVDSVYPDDGLSLNIDSSGNFEFDEQTADFNDPYVEANGDLMVPVFAVNYGQQNQNYFRSVKLDQREFAETMESLQVIESLSQSGDKSKSSYAGNNLFNVYKTRSYSAEVEMLGNPMIQPMMYFQLNNIPMFRGAYLIYKVNHSIRPNHMTTNIKGNRVKKAKTPLMKEETMYLNIVRNSQGFAQVGTRSEQGGYYSQIIQTLIDNGVTNAYIDKGKTYGQITTKDVDMTGTNFKNGASFKYMITEASVALTAMLQALSKYLDSIGHPKNGGLYGKVGSLYRDYASQSNLAKGQKTAAAAGTSYHGWGLAVDMTWTDKNGDFYSRAYKTGSPRSDFDLTNDVVLKWLYDNSYVYGFINPDWARNGGSYDEVWHWEYHGTTAKCAVLSNPTVFGQPIDTSKDINRTIVKNPKTPAGTEAVYDEVNCSYKYIKTADGSEDVQPESTVINDATRAQNQLTVKNFFKKYSLSKEAVAGIMGNIQKESTYNPQALSASGQYYGLIQWDIWVYYKEVKNLKTVDEQLNYLIGMSHYQEYLNKLVELANSGQRADAAEAAYWFAKIVERCAGCKGSYSDFLNGRAKGRASYAEDFFNRFNNSGDALKW